MSVAQAVEAIAFAAKSAGTQHGIRGIFMASSTPYAASSQLTYKVSRFPAVLRVTDPPCKLVAATLFRVQFPRTTDQDADGRWLRARHPTLP